MSLEIRYCNGKCITEKFISFIECENLSGESRAILIMNILTKAELNLENLRGQWYDGALSGKVKGASTIIMNKYPKATDVHYIVHCRLYVLNISIVNACKMPLIQNMVMVILLEICIFFKYSAKRQDLVEENITHIYVESSKKKLVNLCKNEMGSQIWCFESIHRTVSSNSWNNVRYIWRYNMAFRRYNKS